MFNNKKKIIIWFVGPVVAFVISILLYYLGPRYDDLGQFLVVFSIAIIFALLVQLLIYRNIYRSWERFTIVYVALSALLVLVTSNQNASLTPIDKEVVTWWTAAAFVVISLALIVYKQYRLKKG